MSQSLPYRLGLPAWAFAGWRGRYFTARPSQLASYARVFNAVEGNTTFYRTPDAATVTRWREAVTIGERLAEAFEVFSTGLETHPGSVDLRYNVGLTRALLGDVDGAVRDFELVLELDPEMRNMLIGTALIIFIFRAVPSPGPGAGWFVKSKLSGARQVLAAAGHEEPIFGSGGGARMAEQYDLPLLGGDQGRRKPRPDRPDDSVDRDRPCRSRWLAQGRARGFFSPRAGAG